jgi:two-component system, NtrC family, response regulator HydG
MKPFAEAQRDVSATDGHETRPAMIHKPFVDEWIQRMPGEHHFALLANDSRLSDEIRAVAEKASGEPLLTCALAGANDLLTYDTDGLLLLAAKDAADAEQIRYIVQEISLRQLPPTVALIILDGSVEDSPPGGDSVISSLENCVAGRFRWPEDACALKKLVRNNLWRRGCFRSIKEEPPGLALGRRLTSHTPSLEGLVDSVTLAASYDVPLLITGETGTGKNHLVRLIHEFSQRKDDKLLVVSCGALVANLIESELFGHTKGAFTGADRAKEGKFAAAGSGTLLLDEIDTLTLEQQANLLRVVETGEFEPVGSNQTQICAARLIVSSNWDLEEGIANGRFRQDLYYRLSVMAFHLPPLRERVQDIGPLSRAIAAFYNAKFRKNLFEISHEALVALENYNWPGNIRQLQNIIQQAVLMSYGPELTLSHLPQTLQKHFAANGGSVNGGSLAKNRQKAEQLVIQRALANAGHSRTEAAQALGISRVTLYKKMKKYGLMNGVNTPPTSSD